MKRLLITGASGLLGWNICRNVPLQEWEPFGIFFMHKGEIRGVEISQADIRDPNAVELLFREIRPDAVIHAAAISDAEYCQTHRAESHQINVKTPIHMADLCRGRSIPFVFTSSDLVFDGSNPPYREGNPVCPVSHYGEQKVQAEKGILEVYPDAAVCRLPLMVGLPGPGSRGILPMLDAMREGRPLRLFVDEFRTPLSAKTAANGLLMAVKKVRGIIHLGGPERISRYDLAKLVAEVFDLREAVFTPSRRIEAKTAAPRPADVTMDSSLAFDLGFRPMPLVEQIREICSEFKNAIREGATP